MRKKMRYPPNSSQFTFNELQDTFDDLMAEFKKVGIKNNLLKKKMRIYKRKIKT